MNEKHTDLAYTHRNEKIGVVGSGIAGCLAAYGLAQAGYEVQIFEERRRAFSGTSETALQAHLGGLYSGNIDTAYDCLEAAVDIKKTMPYMLSDRRAMFLVAEDSEITLDSYTTFYNQLTEHYSGLPVENQVFGHPENFYQKLSSRQHDFAKNVTGGIMTQEPGLNMGRARQVLLGALAQLGVRIMTESNVLTAERKNDYFALEVQQNNTVNEYYYDQVVNAGGYRCRELDYTLGDRTEYTLSLEAKNLLRDSTPGKALPPFYVVRGPFVHMTPLGDDDRLLCLNTATNEGGYIDTITCNGTADQLPDEWLTIMNTGKIPDAPKRQQSMLQYVNDRFLTQRHLTPAALIPGISTSFSSSRQNRVQHDVNEVTPGWLTITPTKATHALRLARSAVSHALAHSARHA